MQFTATCSAGLEGLIQAEVSTLGGTHCRAGRGIVQWSGSLESGYRVCLWSRYASRVLLKIDEQPVSSADELYEFGRLQRWEDHLGPSSSFAVDANCAKGGPVSHSHYASLRLKDAIVDSFREKNGVRPDVVLQRPDIRFNIHVGPQSTLLSLDLSGEGLHRRGYRVSGGVAPLRETLAAALVSLSGWSGDTPLLDPMCGSGTILIEAALMAGDLR